MLFSNYRVMFRLQNDHISNAFRVRATLIHATESRTLSLTQTNHL
ncbi:unnamed protein product [Chondrus crispus]|uniref:Uncharacterized protein n=1 Tax=Chondrus crispus TaxID=2769 RepID=R7Q898_CHOCR|nr:unnamed protein product [Chondrus crispus]CDF33710.1 unnamed protein product [Chondrus crispus]|eukprot:XP_005713529.1 unnamed protein product [Chondrus crispus]